MSDLIKNLAIFGASGALIGTKSSFADIPATTVPAANVPATTVQYIESMSMGLLIFILVLIVIFLILLLIATYKLTNSGLHTLLCFLFGIVYVLISYIYYGLAGYKFTKKF